MKRKLALLLACALASCVAVFALMGCSSGSSGDSGEAANGKITELIVGFDQDYPPYGFIGDDGEYTGFDLDLAQEVCDRNGWEFTATPINWDAKDAEIESGSITCIWNGFTMEGREDSYTFSEPYMLNEQVVVVKADSGIESLEDLAGKYVTTQADSAAQDVLEGDQEELAATFAELATLAEYNTAFMDLESGGVDAVACDLSIAQYQIAHNPGAYVMIEEPLSSEHYAVGFKLGSDDLAQQVSDTLREMYEDGTVEKLCEKYADYGLTFDNWVLK